MQLITIAVEAQANVNIVRIAIRQELQAIARSTDYRTRLGAIRVECELACGIIARGTYSTKGNVSVRFYGPSNNRYTEIEADYFLMGYAHRTSDASPVTHTVKCGFCRNLGHLCIDHKEEYAREKKELAAKYRSFYE